MADALNVVYCISLTIPVAAWNFPTEEKML
jgi:hypothetical protein